MRISDILRCRMIMVHRVGVVTCVVIEHPNCVPMSGDKAFQQSRRTVPHQEIVWRNEYLAVTSTA
jgi:hypothetical protein